MNIDEYLADAKKHYLSVLDMYLKDCKERGINPDESLILIASPKKQTRVKNSKTVKEALQDIITEAPSDIPKIINQVKAMGIIAENQTIRTQLHLLVVDENSGIYSPFRGVYARRPLK